MRPELLVSIALLTATPASGQDVDVATGLAIGPGWQLVRANCGGCHSYKLITAQQGDRQRWLATIRWMQDTQNLWQFDAETEDGILTYLAENYPPQPKRRRAPIPSSLMPPPEKAEN